MLVNVEYDCSNKGEIKRNEIKQDRIYNNGVNFSKYELIAWHYKRHNI